MGSVSNAVKVFDKMPKRERIPFHAMKVFDQLPQRV